MPEEILQRREDRLLTRHGKAVRHPSHPWSPATRALLEQLSAVGFAQSPRLVGTDGQADLLSYIPGASRVDGWAPAASEEGLAATARPPPLARRETPAPYETGSHRPRRCGLTARSAQAVQVRWSVMATSGPGTSSGTALRQSGCSTSSTPDPETRWTTWRTPASTSYRSGRTPIACGGCAIPSHRTAVGGSRSSPRRMGSAQRTDLSIE